MLPLPSYPQQLMMKLVIVFRKPRKLYLRIHRQETRFVSVQHKIKVAAMSYLMEMRVSSFKSCV